jgi:hypothetical protein
MRSASVKIYPVASMNSRRCLKRKGHGGVYPTLSHVRELFESQCPGMWQRVSRSEVPELSNLRPRKPQVLAPLHLDHDKGALVQPRLEPLCNTRHGRVREALRARDRETRWLPLSEAGPGGGGRCCAPQIQDTKWELLVAILA